MHFCAWKCSAVLCCSVFFSLQEQATLRGRGEDTRGGTGEAQLGAGWRARGLLQPGLVGSSFRPFLQWFGFQRRITFIFSFSICTFKPTFSFINQCFCLLAPMLRKPA